MKYILAVLGAAILAGVGGFFLGVLILYLWGG